MKISIIGIMIIFACSSSGMCSSSDDSDDFLRLTSSLSPSSIGLNGTPRYSLTPRSCSYTEWLDALAPKRQKASVEAASPDTTSPSISICEARDELYRLKDQFDTTRWALRESAEDRINKEIIQKEEDHFWLEVEYWNSVLSVSGNEQNKDPMAKEE